MKFDTLKEKIVEKLKNIYDPEMSVNIYDLGLIYSIECEKKEDDSTFCLITMTLTSAGCPISETLYSLVCNIEKQIDGEYNLVIETNIVFDPPWTRDMMSDDAKLALGML